MEAESLSANVERVRERIAAAAGRSGRPPGAVRLVAVTKSVGAAVAAELVRLGVGDLGENRVDALARKQEALAAEGLRPRWHMIGHLQRNKVKPFLATGALLHSMDGDRLADALAERAPGGAPLPVLLEVNVSGEASKGGFPPDAVAPALERLEAAGRLAPRGLMTMAPISEDPEAARPLFRALRELRDRLRARHADLAELSMGMSQDYEVAVEEGATLVRVGTALFEGLP